MSEFRDFIAHGWRLCAIDKGKKAPTYPAWNVNPIPEDAADGLDGAGLLHALSGTCALDIDAMAQAKPWLAERGVDVDALLDADNAVQIVSGRAGRAKLLYRMKRPLRTFKPPGSGLELRCATAAGASVQDVLPPTIHPDTKKPYEWGGGLLSDWRDLPPIPAGLLAIWRELAENDGTPTAIPSERPRATIDLVKLRKAAMRHSPDCEYDEWIKVGMQLHDGTGGAQEGFDIWCEWSRGVKRVAYPGDAVLKSHWFSFNSDGKHAAKGTALVNELPADADEFDIVPEAQPGATTTSDLIEEKVKVTRDEAIKLLLDRLVYVRKAERYFDLKEHTIIGSDNALEHLFTHMMPKKNGSKVSPIKLLKANGARQVHALGFHPGEGVTFTHKGREFANSYVNNLPAPLEPTAEEREKILWLFDRIDDVLFREWLMQFFAHVVQKPGVKIMSAPLIWSPTTGNGKSTLLEEIPKLLVGDEYSRSVNSSLLEGDHNGYLLNAWHVALKEFRALSRGNRWSITEKLKDWITASSIALRAMYTDAYDLPNHFFVTASSNSPDAALLDDEDRRWAVHEMHALAMTQAEVRWIYHEFLLTPRAAPVLRHFFLNLSLEGFTASAKAPLTEARAEMIAASKGVDEELLTTALEQRTAPLDRDVVLLSDVVDFVRKQTRMSVNNVRMGRLLMQPPFNGIKIQVRDGDARYWATVLRNHAQWHRAPHKDVLAHIRGDDVAFEEELDLRS